MKLSTLVAGAVAVAGLGLAAAIVIPRIRGGAGSAPQPGAGVAGQNDPAPPAGISDKAALYGLVAGIVEKGMDAWAARGTRAAA